MRSWRRSTSSALTFTLDLAAKDVALLLAEAERHGTPATLTRVVLERLRWAIRERHGGKDMAALARLVRDQDGDVDKA